MKLLRTTAGIVLLGVLAACASAPEESRVAAPAPIASVQQAGQRLAQVAAERAAIEARFAAREQVCYEQFFVNHCLDQAKERRRSALAAQRAIEIEAEHYQRQAKVAERDREMAAADAEYKAEEAKLAAEPPKPSPEATEAPPPRPGSVAERVQRHDQRERQAVARDKAEAAERAANVAAYERRKAESEERQRMVKQRMAEKAAKAEREAKEKAAEEAAPAH